MISEFIMITGIRVELILFLAYLEDYLPMFRRWFRETYKPVKLPAYLKSKDKNSLP